MLYGTIFFFVFEMLRLKDRIQSESPIDYSLRRKRARVEMAIVFLLVIIQACLVTANVLFRGKGPSQLFDSFIISRGVTLLLVFGYMAFRFNQALSFLIRLKIKRLDGDELSPYNKRVIVLIYAILGVQILIALISGIVFTL